MFIGMCYTVMATGIAQVYEGKLILVNDRDNTIFIYSWYSHQLPTRAGVRWPNISVHQTIKYMRN